jgi:hypothetical protein
MKSIHISSDNNYVKPMATAMRILLVEFGTHKTELLSAYNVFIAAGYEVHIAIPWEEIITGKELPNTHIIPSAHRSDHNRKTPILRAMAVKSLIKKLNINVVYLNTFQGKDVEFLLYSIYFSKKYKVMAVIHNADLLHKLKMKLLVRRIDQLFVLSADVAKYVHDTFNIDAKTFQMIDFCDNYNYKRIKIARDPSNLYIAISGEVSFTRRNYSWLVDICTKNKAMLSGKIVFDIIGNINSADGLKVAALVKQNGLDELFDLHYYRLADDEFFACVDSCDAILPLTGGIKYTFCKVHGSQVMAAAFRKLYLQDEKCVAEAMRPVSLVYNDDNFCELLLALREDRMALDVRDNYVMESVPLHYRIKLIKDSAERSI